MRHTTQFPEAQLGHIENILIFVLEGLLRLLLGEGGRAKFIRRNEPMGKMKAWIFREL